MSASNEADARACAWLQRHGDTHDAGAQMMLRTRSVVAQYRHDYPAASSLLEEARAAALDGGHLLPASFIEASIAVTHMRLGDRQSAFHAMASWDDQPDATSPLAGYRDLARMDVALLDEDYAGAMRFGSRALAFCHRTGQELLRCYVAFRHVTCRYGPSVGLRQVMDTIVANKRKQALVELRALVADGLSHREVGERLGRSQAWVTKMLSVDRLPAAVRREVASGVISTSQAIEIARYWEEPNVVESLVDAALGGASVRELRRLGLEATCHPSPHSPRRFEVGERSWVERRRSRDGLKLVVHVADDADHEAIVAALEQLLEDRSA